MLLGQAVLGIGLGSDTRAEKVKDLFLERGCHTQSVCRGGTASRSSKCKRLLK